MYIIIKKQWKTSSSNPVYVFFTPIRPLLGKCFLDEFSVLSVFYGDLRRSLPLWLGRWQDRAVQDIGRRIEVDTDSPRRQEVREGQELTWGKVAVPEAVLHSTGIAEEYPLTTENYRTDIGPQIKLSNNDERRG